MRTQAKLLDKYMHTAPQGKVAWIGVRPGRKLAMQRLAEVNAIASRGLDGDHRAAKASTSSRQVSLINQENITAVASLLGRDTIDPAVLRRNLVITGLNLYALRYQRLQIGEAVLELRAHCHPCVRMEQALGSGAVLALYGHAGFCATVIESGVIREGDWVRRLPPEDAASN